MTIKIEEIAGHLAKLQGDVSRLEAKFDGKATPTDYTEQLKRILLAMVNEGRKVSSIDIDWHDPLGGDPSIHQIGINEEIM